jgi:hypothetical protein
VVLVAMVDLLVQPDQMDLPFQLLHMQPLLLTEQLLLLAARAEPIMDPMVVEAEVVLADNVQLIVPVVQMVVLEDFLVVEMQVLMELLTLVTAVVVAVEQELFHQLLEFMVVKAAMVVLDSCG